MQLDLAPASPRVLALAFPDLGLQRALRSRPGAPALAVVEEGRVVQCSAAARAAGVRTGDSLTQARAACAGIDSVPHDPAADRAALRALAEAMLALAPSVEVAPDALLLDAGAARLAPPAAALPGGDDPGGDDPGGDDPGGDGEVRLAERGLALARDLGYDGRAAVADGKGPARALARHGGERVLRAPPGAALRALAPLPLAALELPPRMEAQLAAVGVRDVGALAALPPETLVHRFGAAGAAAARLARGEDPRPLVPYLPETLPEESWDFGGAQGQPEEAGPERPGSSGSPPPDLHGPVESVEPLLFGLRRLAERVAARLAGRGLGATRLRLTLRLDPRGEERLFFPLARPSASASVWLLLLRERLMDLRLDAPVAGLALAAVEAAEVAAEQLAMGDRPEVARALEAVLSRLAARLGEAALFAAEPADRYRPEAAYRPVPFAPRRGGAARGAAVPPATRPPAVNGTPVPVRPTRLLHPARPVVAEGEGGRLTALRVEGRAHAVVAMVGPERLAGEWWIERFDRDYYRVRLEGLGDAWVYRDGLDGRLYLHGLFD